jgi:hypothetical protein
VRYIEKQKTTQMHIKLFEEFLKEGFNHGKMKEGQRIQYWDQSAKSYVEGVVTSIDKKASKVIVNYEIEVSFGDIDNWYENPWAPKRSELEANLRSIEHLKR